METHKTLSKFQSTEKSPAEILHHKKTDNFNFLCATYNLLTVSKNFIVGTLNFLKSDSGL